MNGRKWLCVLLLGALLCLPCTAALGEGAQDAFLQAHPGYTLEAMETCGDTAAAVPEAYSSYDVVSVDPTVIGVLGGEWLHVWYPETGQSGFMRTDALHLGNG